MIKNIQIRPATTADAAAFLGLWEALDSETEFMMYEQGERKTTLEQQTKRLRDATDSEHVYMLCAIDTSESQLVGFAGAQRPLNQRDCHKASLVLGVRATHWGFGIGGALLQYLESWCEQQKVHRVQLTVAKPNKRAIKLYRKHGFRLEGIQKHAVRLRSGYLDQYLMAKLLD